MEKTMYTLGSICRLIWPGPGETPEIILSQLHRPASCLALVAKHPDNTKDKEEALADLLDKLDTISDPEGGVSEDIQSNFWLGYYHYAHAMDVARTYGPAELELTGQALYGDRWQTDLTRALGLSDSRRIRQWMAGERPIPVGVWADACALLRKRGDTIKGLLKKLDK